MASPEREDSDGRVVDGLVNELIEIVRGLAGERCVVSPTINLLTEANLDSLEMLQLDETIRNRYGVSLITHEGLKSISTLRDMAQFISDHKRQQMQA